MRHLNCEIHPPAIIIKYYDSPCGRLMLGSFGNCLCLCDWLSGKTNERIHARIIKQLRAEFSEGTSACLDMATSQLNEYFAGKRRDFDVPLLSIGTEFQKYVWKKLMDVPYGATESYGALAMRVGTPSAVRAVANANGANPISIFVPCHRIIGSNGSLTGYGGGLAVKQFLIRLESDNSE
ncbi:MAG: methylated-DNA--[protein]-cysteine S-methyltransferase [Duncaniella sp.]|nr:methylated-DNA--[protein]-cysteine S-methyltransferase [Duncaniella sp.]